MDDADLRIRNLTYELLVALGRVPSAEEASIAAGADIGESWQRLHDAHALVLDEPRAAVPAKDRVDRGSRQAQSPAELVRAESQLRSRTQNRPLNRCRRLPRRAVRPRTAIAKPSPRRARPTHFDAVCREQPTTIAAAVIVAPANTKLTSRSR